MAEHWMQHAVKHKGAETASAKRAGMSVHEYAEKQYCKNDPKSRTSVYRGS